MPTATAPNPCLVVLQHAHDKHASDRLEAILAAAGGCAAGPARPMASTVTRSPFSVFLFCKIELSKKIITFLVSQCADCNDGIDSDLLPQAEAAQQAQATVTRRPFSFFKSKFVFLKIIICIFLMGCARTSCRRRRLHSRPRPSTSTVATRGVPGARCQKATQTPVPCGAGGGGREEWEREITS